MSKGFRKSKKEKKPKLGLNPEFVQEAESASVEVLKEKIVSFQKGIEVSQRFLKGDAIGGSDADRTAAEKLTELKTAYDEAAKPTREAIKALKNRTSFVLDLLGKKGA